MIVETFTRNEFSRICAEAGHANKEQVNRYLKENEKLCYTLEDLMDISDYRKWISIKPSGDYLFGGKYVSGHGRTTKRYAPYHG